MLALFDYFLVQEDFLFSMITPLLVMCLNGICKFVPFHAYL